MKTVIKCPCCDRDLELDASAVEILGLKDGEFDFREEVRVNSLTPAKEE